MAALNEYLQNKAKVQNAAAKTEFQKFAASTESRIAELETKNTELEQQNEMLLECLLEISEIIYA